MGKDYTKALKTLRKRLSALEAERSSYVSHWREIQGVMAPDLGRFPGDKDNDGSKKQGKILDNTALLGIENLAAGLQSGLTSPATPWFKLSVALSFLLKNKAVKEWLFIVETMMQSIMQKSNIYNALHHTYSELAAYGTGCFALLFDFDNVIRAIPYTTGEYYLGLNAKREVDTFYRVFNMTSSQIVEEFGIDNVSDAVKTAYDNDNTEQKFEIVHAIEKNDDRIELKDFMNRPYRCVYFEKTQSDKILKVTGMSYFPILAPRWNIISGDVYGRSPGMNVLGDTKMLQEMNVKLMKALDKQIDPPMQAPASLKDEFTVQTIPDGVTYIDNLSNSECIRPLYQPNVDLQGTLVVMDKVISRINAGLKSDLFKMMQQSTDPRMTAREVAERHEEKLTMLGPVLERLYNELLNKLVNILFQIMIENNMLPPPPPEMQGQELKVEYISILAQAQRMSGITSMQQVVGFVGNLAAVKPEALDKINFDATIDEYADIAGVIPSMIYSNEEVLKVRQARAKAMQVQQQAAQTQQFAETANTGAQAARLLSETKLGDNSVMDTLLGGAGR